MKNRRYKRETTRGELTREESVSWTNRLHSVDDEPAVIETFANGQVHYQEWYYEGQRHRDNKPAILMYDENGDLLHWEWYHFGKLHRENHPANWRRDYNGLDDITVYYHHGMEHRIDGPSYIATLSDGTVKEEWHLYGKECTFDEWIEKSPCPDHIKIELKMKR